MSLAVRLSFSSLLLFLLAVLTGCGSGNIATPAPEGFTSANLNGTYAFSVTGTDVSGTFFSIAGSLQANGSGTITGGTVDINSPGALGAPATNQAITGTYNVLSDGRTSASITTPVGTFAIDFVLLSSSNGLVIRFDNNGSASGSLDLQNSSAFSDTALAGSFAFGLSGIDSAGNSTVTAGAFTFNSSGGVTAGIQDVNENGLSAASNSPITGGAVVTAANGRGTISLDTGIGTLDFAFYVIDQNHIRLVSTDNVALGTAIFSGDAFRQPASFTDSTALPAGSFAFTLAGSSTNNILVAGGTLSADGNGNITSGSEDTNANGTLTQNIALGGAYTMAATGRGTLNLTGSGQSFAIYPTMTGGLLLLDLGGVAGSGTALQQQGTPFSTSSVSGTYGMNLSGVNLNENGFEVDALAQITATAGSFNGSFDLNNEGALSPSGAFSGNFSINSNGRGTGQWNIPNEGSLGLGALNIIYYVASSSKVLFIEGDPGQPSVGIFEQQQAP